MKDYLKAHDWFAKDVYLTQDWIDKETRLFELMRKAGFMGKDEKNPRFEVHTP
jgi:hypothetical protein